MLVVSCCGAVIKLPHTCMKADKTGHLSEAISLSILPIELVFLMNDYFQMLNDLLGMIESLYLVWDQPLC